MDNITTEQGWSVTWDMKKLMPMAVQMIEYKQRIPLIMVFRFHRYISICEISLDVEAHLAPGEGSPLPNITIAFGKDLLWNTSSLSHQQNGLFHFQFFVRDFGHPVKGFTIRGHGFSFANETIRRVRFSNLVIYEKFEHHVHDHLFVEFQEGAESRLSSAALKARFAEEPHYRPTDQPTD